MTIAEICSAVSGKVICGSDKMEKVVTNAFASDLLSDVLTIKTGKFMLITGCANVQCLRTAEMADISVVLFARNKTVSEDMLSIARENGIIIIVSPFSLFKCSGILYNAGINPVY